MRNQIFDMHSIETIHGFNNYEAMVLMDCFLRYIEPENTLEIGTWDGRTSVIIASNTSGEFRYIECDPGHWKATYENVTKHAGLPEDKIHGYQAMSCFADLDKVVGRCMDFIHIDGGHSLECVEQDLEMCSRLLKPSGLMVLDDVFSATYPHITEAVYDFVSRRKEFKLLMVGLNKGFICFNGAYLGYVDFIIDHLLNEMRRYPYLDNALFSICKTSPLADSTTYGIIGQDPRYDTHRYRGNESCEGNPVERIFQDTTLS